MPLLPRKNILDYNANSIISAGKQVSSKSLLNMAKNAEEDFKSAFANISDVKTAKDAMEQFIDYMGQIVDIFQLMKSTGRTLVDLPRRGSGRTKGAKNKPKVPKTEEQIQEEAIRKSTYSQPSGLLSMMMSAEPNTRFTPQTVQQYRNRVVSEGAVARGTPSGQEAIVVQGKRGRRPKVPKQDRGKITIIDDSGSDKSSVVSESEVLRRRRSRSRSQQSGTGVGQVQQMVADIESRSGGAPVSSPTSSATVSIASNPRSITSRQPLSGNDDDDVSALGDETSQFDYEEYDADAGDGDIGLRMTSRSPQDRIIGLILRGTQILRRLNQLVSTKIRKDIKSLAPDDIEELKYGYTILKEKWIEVEYPPRRVPKEDGTGYEYVADNRNVFVLIDQNVAFAEEMLGIMNAERQKAMTNILVVVNNYNQNDPEQVQRPSLMPVPDFTPVYRGGTRFRDEGFRRIENIPNIYGRFQSCPTKYLL